MHIVSNFIHIFKYTNYNSNIQYLRAISVILVILFHIYPNYFYNGFLGVDVFFIIGLIFSFFLIIGYKPKLSHIICAIVIISIHNRAIMLEIACDMFMNSVLIWTMFFHFFKHTGAKPEVLSNKDFG